MAREYKQTQVVAKIYTEMNRFLNAMDLMDKRPTTLWLRKQDYDRLLIDETKRTRINNPKAPPVKSVPDYKGIKVGVYN